MPGCVASLLQIARRRLELAMAAAAPSWGLLGPERRRQLLRAPRQGRTSLWGRRSRLTSWLISGGASPRLPRGCLPQVKNAMTLTEKILAKHSNNTQVRRQRRAGAAARPSAGGSSEEAPGRAGLVESFWGRPASSGNETALGAGSRAGAGW